MITMDWKRIFRANYAQMIFVCAAFALMVLIGCISVGNVLRKEKLSTVTVALDESEKTIRAYLREPKIAFESIYTSVGDMLDRNESQEAVLAYLTQITNTMAEKEEGVMGFLAVYGYIRGEFIDGIGLNPGDDFIPQQRPWYQLAVRNDEAEYTAPYLDAKTGTMVMSLAQEIYGASGDYYGVLSMDINISWLMEYAETLQFAEGGYGMIVNEFIYVIAHPQDQYRNIPLQDLGDGYAEIAGMLRVNSDISAVSIRDIDNTRVITFFKQLYNGWYIGVVMPNGSYYADLYFTAFLLAALGIALMATLNLILLRLSAAKIRSEEESKSKTSFLAQMSHEIRTPMNAIIGMAELALREDIPITAYEHILTIKQSGANLLSIINDILDFSKIESGKLEIITRDYQFASLINDVINIIRMRVMDTPLRFVANIDSSIPAILIGDEVKIRQVLLNLLSNAVKYTDEGFVSLTIACEITDKNTAALTIEVADSGRGIKEEDMDKLFGNFVQIDMMDNKGIEGSGLGLAITQHMVKAMGGSITVHSTFGKGSTFTVSLIQKFGQYNKLASVENPEQKSILVYERRGIYADSIVQTAKNLGVLCTIAATESAFYKEMEKGTYTFVFISSYLLQKAKRVIAKLKSGAKIVLLTEFGEAIAESHLSILTMPVHTVSIANILNDVSDSYQINIGPTVQFTAPSAKILIVDDVNTNLKVAEGLMKPYQMQIDLCKSGREAVAAIQQNHYDLVMMDHMMPEMDGVEATKRIRALDVDYAKNVPVIALTANAVSGAREMFLQNGLDDFLSKPIDTYKLYSILEKWIPKEKQVKSVIENKEDAAHNTLEISGVDTVRGIALTGGTLDHYIKTLTIFHMDGKQKIDEIHSSLASDNLSLYVICVHALKSALASIGAVKLSEAANALEAAGNKGDWEYIDVCNDTFLLELEVLLRNISEVLPSRNGDIPPTPTSLERNEAIRRMVQYLQAFKPALEALDISGINSAVDCLQEFKADREYGAAIENILLDTLIGEYEDAISLIDTLLRDMLH